MGKQRDLRVGDRERELAMELLGRHMSAGRLEVDEYDQRCVRAASARYASELDALFDDLPSPRPSDHAPVPVRPAPRPAPATWCSWRAWARCWCSSRSWSSNRLSWCCWCWRSGCGSPAAAGESRRATPPRELSRSARRVLA
ncbi:DUF1707 domain-containing protein [Saccharopolyspora spinosporotrichia]